MCFEVLSSLLNLMRGVISESTAEDPCGADSIELVVAMLLLENGATISAN